MLYIVSRFLGASCLENVPVASSGPNLNICYTPKSHVASLRWLDIGSADVYADFLSTDSSLIYLPHVARITVALVAHKLHSDECRRERRRYLRFIARNPFADINDYFADASLIAEDQPTTDAADLAVNSEGSEGQHPRGADTNDEAPSEDESDYESDVDDGDSDESDDDDVTDEGGDFNTALEFFRFVIGCNGGQGLSDEATAWLFKLLRDPRVDLEAIRPWRTKHAVIQYGLRLMLARRVYRQVEVRIPGVDHTFELMCTSPVEAALDEIYGPGQVVSPIIISSDATILSGNERVKVWAVYLSIANIHLRLRWGDSGKILLALLPMPVHGMTAEQKVQLFQAAMQVVLADLIVASHTMVQLVESTFPRDGSGWNLVKVHLLLHLPEAIRRGGLPREYSAAVYENAHIRTCKRPYRRSNHRDLLRAIAQHNTNTALLTRLPTNLEGDRQYNTAMRRAIATGLPQLCRQRSRMHSAISDREQAPLDLYATYDAAIPGGIGPYAYLTRLYGYVSFPAWSTILLPASLLRFLPNSFHQVHTALALPAHELDYGLIRPHYARASPSHHGAPAFSFIEYENGSGEIVHGRVHLLLTLVMNSEDAHPSGEAVAFVRQWYPSQVDEGTGCMRMRPSYDELSYDLVPVNAVQRTVHMVESFVTPGLWYLNKWAGRYREELT
ncbi:unnamed protein product [Closterium sp. Yama58-4]|nr:unnamed protein product [Closterium sp. Yama58-4]